MLFNVRFQKIGDLGHQWIVGVRVTEKRADRQQHLGDGECGRPLVLEDVEADGTVAVDVAVVNFSRKRDLGGLEGVLGREMNVEEEDAADVGGVFGSHDGSLPVHLVSLVGGASRAVSGGVPTEVDKLFLYSF